ncbi:hypothetical protein LZ30DRAFT_449627 [Colletotrichum cereale]|nr:hypothetical protein LZ30DRAFT_449627 [Colletotrichum cereale]
MKKAQAVGEFKVTGIFASLAQTNSSSFLIQHCNGTLGLERSRRNAMLQMASITKRCDSRRITVAGNVPKNTPKTTLPEEPISPFFKDGMNQPIFYRHVLPGRRRHTTTGKTSVSGTIGARNKGKKNGSRIKPALVVDSLYNTSPSAFETEEKPRLERPT